MVRDTKYTLAEGVIARWYYIGYHIEYKWHNQLGLDFTEIYHFTVSWNMICVGGYRSSNIAKENFFSLSQVLKFCILPYSTPFFTIIGETVSESRNKEFKEKRKSPIKLERQKIYVIKQHSTDVLF